MRKFLVLFSIIFLSSTVYSQNNDLASGDELISELEMIYGADIIVTASKREQSIASSPSTVSVITEEDIRQSGATTFAEVLNYVPGVHFGYTTYNHMLVGGIRGFQKLPANKIVLLIDGVPYSFEVYGIPGWNLMPVSLEEIKRIEVLRGAGSSLYGANAMFGVINVITKKARESDKNLFALTVGEQDILLADYFHAEPIVKDKLYYRVGWSWDQRNNWDYVAYADERVEEFSRVNLALDYLPNDNSEVNFNAAYMDTSKFYSVQESTGPIDFGNSKFFHSLLSYNMKEPNIILRAYYDKKDLWDTGWAKGSRTYYFRMGTKGVDFQHTFQPIEKDILTWGANYTQVWANGPAVNGKRRHDMRGVFVDNTYSFNEKFSLSTGLRYDHHPNTADNLSHRVSFMYNPSQKHGFRFTWATAFRNPDFIENYYDAYVVFPLVTAKGSEQNEPERAEMFEIAYRGEWNKLKVNTNFFFNKVADIIAFRRTSATTYEFINLENMKQYGLELELEYPFTDWLIGKLGYTHYEVWEEEIADNSFSIQSPDDLAFAQLRAYLNKKLSVNLGLQYTGPVIYPPYTWSDPRRTTIAGGKADKYIIADLRIGYNFELWGNDAELSLAIKNLLDERYDDYPLDTADVGRTITGKFKYKF